jgi:alkaline phosphatase
MGRRGEIARALMNNKIPVLLVATALSAIPAWSQARNIILFIGDGGGLTSLNAASIYGYGKAQALYIQSMPNVGLADSSTSIEWVTDGTASASAMATGKKGRNGVLSMSPSGAKSAEAYKTVLEYAEEKGLSTGLIDNSKEGIIYDTVAAFYAHANLGFEDPDIYRQFLKPRFGDGPDVVFVTNNEKLNAALPHGIETVGADLKMKGYTFARTMDNVSSLDGGKTRVVGMFDSDDFDVAAAAKQAVARLSRNPKGFLLVVHSDCHLAKTRPSLVRLVDLDKAVRAAGEEHRPDTLIIYTADHGYALYVKGEKATEALKATDHKRIVEAIHLEDQHTAEEVPVAAIGPGSERVKGFMSNTDVFHIMMAAYGWEKPASASR